MVTAWLALSEASEASGAMKFLPGSHELEQIGHLDTFDEHNLLSRGQVIDLDVAEEMGVLAPLKPGELSLHHVRSVHASSPNSSGDRRIGLAIRYIPPHVRQLKVRDSAILVRGTDSHGHFDWEPDPRADLDAAALAAHARATERQFKTLMDGTGQTAFRA